MLTRRRPLRPAVSLLAFLAACDPGGDPAGPGAAARVEISAPSTFVESGQKLLLSAVVRDASGRTLQNAQVAWSSGSPTVAEVSGGLVTGRSPGAAFIRAAVGAAVDSVRVTVEGPSAVEIGVWPDTLFLIRGRTGRLFVELRDPAGKPSTQPLIFTTSAAEVATVAASGEVQGISPGVAQVTVTAGLRSVQVPVRVVTGDRYSLRDLGSLGESESRASDVSNRGEVVGWAHSPPSERRRPFVWRGGRIVDLGIVSGFDWSEALAVSDSGAVLGAAGPFGRAGAARQNLWVSRSGSTTVIQNGDVRFPYTFGGDVDARGRVVGFSGSGWEARGRPFLWQSGRLTEPRLPDPEAGDPNRPWAGAPAAINVRGEVALTVYSHPPDASSTAPDESAAYVWAGDRYSRVPLPAVSRWSTALGMNDRGHVVGSYFLASERADRGFLWDGAQATDLGTLVAPTGINHHGDVVGGRFLRRGGRTLDLNGMLASPGWEVEEARKINDLGWIAGTARNRATGERRAVLLVPAS